jgi:hypothetical protein
MKSCYLAFLMGLAMAADETAERGASSSVASAVSVAQQLKAPPSTALYGGEDENSDWWDEHEELLREARREWGRKHPDLYEWTRAFQESYLDPALLRAFDLRNETLLREQIKPTQVDGVYKIQLFRPDFAERLLDELDHHEASRIPLRRPNGMNRYGAILGDLGFDKITRGLVSDILTPVARSLLPQHVGPNDITHHYAFTVRYRPDQDVELAEHADASVVTVNVCLEPDPTEHKILYFKGYRSHNKPSLPWWSSQSIKSGSSEDPTKFVELSRPGQAVIHLGQIVHGVAPVGGRRSNLVVWLFGEHGDVRVAQYDDVEVGEHAKQYSKFWSHEAKAPVAERPFAMRDATEDDEL